VDPFWPSLRPSVVEKRPVALNLDWEFVGHTTTNWSRYRSISQKMGHGDSWLAKGSILGLEKSTGKRVL